MNRSRPVNASSGARLRARGVSLSYEGDPVVSDLSLDIPDGAITSIIGPNGSGKSTLLRGLGRLLKPVSGQVTLDGHPLGRLSTRHVATQISILTQTPSAPSGMTVSDLVSRGRSPRQRWYQQFSAVDEDEVRAALEATEIADLADEPLDELSGGQRQRAWISMTLAQDTGIMLLDEPTTYLDLAHQLEVLELVRRLHAERGRTVVMVLHDISMASRFSDHIVAMRAGEVVASGTPDDVVEQSVLRDVFGLDAEVVFEPTSRRPHVIPLRVSRSVDPA